MTYVVTEDCVGCKYTSCVSVCPVDCFREGPMMLVIDPDACIDCGVCEPECPAGAIVPETTPEGGRWLEMNARFAAIWPEITVAVEPLETAELLLKEKGKYERYMEDILSNDETRRD